MTGRSGRPFEIEVAGRTRRVSVDVEGAGFIVHLDGVRRRVDLARCESGMYSLIFPDEGGKIADVSIRPDEKAGDLVISVDGVTLRSRQSAAARKGRSANGAPGTPPSNGDTRVKAPMPGKIIRILVTPGETVRARQAVAVMEAMKMENEIRATGDGVVREIPVTEGASIEAGTVICVIG
jgi:biotin carboxyl carrier protein